MQETTDLLEIGNRVFEVSSKDFKSMVLTAEGMTLMGKRVANIGEFWEVYEKGGVLNMRAKIEHEKFKNFVFEQGEKKMNIGYKKLLEMGVPGDLEFNNESDMNDVLSYIEKKWSFTRTEKQLSPLKATVPYLLALLVTLAATGFVIYVNTVGGSFRVNIIAILLIKLSEMIGFIGTVLLGLVICVFIIRALFKAVKNPPVEVRLEPRM